MPDAPEPLSEELLFAFGGISKGLREWVRSRLGIEPGVTVGRAGLLLGLLERGEPVSMSAFGAAHDLTPRSMTVLVSGLEREGLIQRSAHPRDGRVTLLSLTAAGRAIATEQLVPARKEAAALFNDLSERDRAELLRLIREVDGHLARRGIETPTPPAN
ncbi:MAG: MarR family transcriptional regulator [Streptosporangiaceae bacterium]|nr:MarR family transcriptional regulator [Streptosporangiaceae bacterium]